MSEFSTLPIPTKPLREVSVEESVQGSLYFNASLLQHVSHGVFWRPTEDYFDFFWESQAKPATGNGAWTGYLLSDNEGGNHNLLWGMAMSGSTYHISGNVHDGTTLTSFSGSETFPADYWCLPAVGWDGSHIMLWMDGVLSHVQAYSATQRRNPGGNTGVLFIGGSDHNNYWGNIAMVRGYEGECRFTSDYAPEKFFRPLYFESSTKKFPQFLTHYTAPQTIYHDLSGGFEDVWHHGVPEALVSVTATDVSSGSSVGSGLTLPTFQPGLPIFGEYLPTAPSTPSGAIVFDSFSRRNRTYLNPTSLVNNTFVLGSTEAGSAGALSWLRIDGSASTGAGVLFGRAFLEHTASDVVVDTATQNVDVRVDRIAAASCNTGLIVRCKDANDYYKIQGTSTNIHVEKHESGVTTTVDYTVSAGWTTLRVVANGTTLAVYTGTSLEGTFTSAGSFTCTNVSGATKNGLARYTNIKELYRYDNFLVKAA